MTPPEATATKETANPPAADPDHQLERLADRLATIEAAGDPERQALSRALRLELEDLFIRSRRDPASLAAVRWSRRLANAVRRADRAENRLARLEQRRWFRIAQVAIQMLQHPLRSPRLLPDLFDAFRRRRLPGQSERTEVGLTPPRVPATSQRPAPYAHMKIAHGGRVRVFEGLARHVEIRDATEPTPDKFDLLLLEPGVDEVLGDVPVEWVDRFTDSGVPSLLFARTTGHLRLPHASRVSLVVTEDAELADDAPVGTLVLDPSVDPRLHHPIGWQRKPEGYVLDLDDTPGLWGENLIREMKAHTAVATTRPDLAVVAAAVGTPVVAPSNPVLDRVLGDLYLSRESGQPIQPAAESMRNSDARERLSVAARRHVLTRHTRLARLEELLDRLSLPRVAPPSISVLLATHRAERLEEAIAGVRRQEYPTLELVLMLHDPTRFDRETVDKLVSQLDFPAQIVECPRPWVLGDCLNAGLEQASGEYVAKMDDDDHYGPLHLEDLVASLQYARAAAVGKLSNVTHLTGQDLTVDWRLHDQERFVHHLPGATMMMRRELALRYRFDRVEHGVDTALWERMRADGLSLYSTHRLNFIRVRHGDHTYGRSDEDFLRLAEEPPETGLDPQKWIG